MSDTGQSQSGFPFAQWVPAGEDRFGEYRGLGISRIDFKLSAQDSDGNLLILENSFREKGGPARHFTREEEWATQWKASSSSR